MTRFPLYELVVNGRNNFYTLSEASRVYDWGWATVEFGDLVITEEGVSRKMTQEEKQEISSLADEYSASK